MAAVGLAAALSLAPSISANAATFTYSSSLSGQNEVPPNASTATGLVTGALSGDPTNWQFSYDVSFDGLSAELILAHIHLAAPDPANPNLPATQRTGPVVHDLNNAPVNQGVTSGMFSGVWTSVDVMQAGMVDPATVYQSFLAGQYYFNLHSDTPEFAAPGEIRGQIEFEQAAAVPEPMTGAAMLAAGAIAVATTRQKQRSAP
ncbi:MAG: CHRD domain-containing protein [Leptolyngbyaceae cyanobacterium T60_A2020_046]|nr:CHRD domain-containing protein [Leptolyngbyaceae cyanobacterium T60_A2020_046]